jgi:hypothetical protein
MWWNLKMQAAQRANLYRQRMVFLDELGCDTGLVHVAPAVGFGKESAGVAMNLWNDKLDLAMLRGRISTMESSHVDHVNGIHARVRAIWHRR